MEPDPPLNIHRAGGPQGRERRAYARAPINLMCEIDIPGLPVMFKAMIMDLSAGGMRLRIPRIADAYLYTPFQIQWPMAGTVVKGHVYFLFRYTEHEIAVRFVQTTGHLSTEISRFVFMVLKSREQGGKLYDPPVPVPAKTSVARQERRRVMMRSDQATLGEALLAAKDRHQSGVQKWLDKRVATHLDAD